MTHCFVREANTNEGVRASCEMSKISCNNLFGNDVFSWAVTQTAFGAEIHKI